MKKNLLSAAVAAGSVVMAGAAVGDASTAAYINDRLTGEALVYPLYSAQNGNDTYIHIVNTTDQTKAVKVRMIEGENSQEVLDFNLYMSPKDHFAFAITADGEGAKLVTTDNSCTVPIIPETGTTADGKTIREVAFRDFLYAKDKAEDDPDTDADESFDNTGEDREQIGYVEVIEMGQLDKSKVVIDKPRATAADRDPYSVATAVKHGADGVPADCSLPVYAWSVTNGTKGVWLDEATDGAGLQGETEFLTNWNGGGLYGFGTVINVAEGTAFGEDAVAIEQLVAAGNAGYQLHYEPGSTDPDFNDPAINLEALVGNPSSGSPLLMTFDANVNQRFETVSALFMADEVMNDYIIDPAINAQTDWVLTFPTKTFHINAAAPGDTADDESLGIYNPFEVPWNGKSACEPSRLAVWDREEAFVPAGGDEPDFSPAPPEQKVYDDLLLCYETTVLQFGDESVTNNDSTVTGVSALLGDYVDGWANLDLGPQAQYANRYSYKTLANGTKLYFDFERTLCGLVNGAAACAEGLPVTGFAAVEYTNGTLSSGAMANYAFSTEHKTAVSFSGDSPTTGN